MEREPGELYWDEEQKCLSIQGDIKQVYQVTIPDLRGLTHDECRDLLMEYGLRVGSVRLAGPWYKRLWFKVRRIFG